MAITSYNRDTSDILVSKSTLMMAATIILTQNREKQRSKSA